MTMTTNSIPAVPNTFSNNERSFLQSLRNAIISLQNTDTTTTTSETYDDSGILHLDGGTMTGDITFKKKDEEDEEVTGTLAMDSETGDLEWNSIALLDTTHSSSSTAHSTLFNAKASTSLDNLTLPGSNYIAYVKEYSRNGTSWYRKYSDGWTMQGGEISNSSSSNTVNVELPITMADTNYFVFITKGNPATGGTFYDSSAYAKHFQVSNYAVDSFDIYLYDSSIPSLNTCRWCVIGQRATI